MANAHNQTAVGASVVDLFWATGNGGSDKDGILAYSVVNDGTDPILIREIGHQGASEWIRLAAGRSITFEVLGDDRNLNIQIQRIQAVRAGSVSSTVSGGAVKRR